MTTPLSLIEKGILSGNWKDVCAGFNKITGKNIEPPKTTNMVAQKVFDIKTAKKTEIYKKLLEFNENLAPAKTYTLEDLREMWTIYNVEQIQPENLETETVQSNADLQILDGFRYVKDPNRLMYDDKKSVKVSMDKVLEKVKENSNFQRKESNSRPTKIKARCTKCKTIFNTYKSYASEIDGELMGVCDVCKESK